VLAVRSDAQASKPKGAGMIRHFPRCPSIFFNVHNVKIQADEIGEELPDDFSAWHEATIIAGELFKDIDDKFQPGQELSLEVTDDKRQEP
jgi:hypothetical protein